MKHVFFAILATASLVTPALSAPPSVLPLPQKIQEQTGTFQITAATSIDYSAELASEATVLALQLRQATGFPIPLKKFDASTPPTPLSIVLEISDSAPKGKEAYRLVASPKGIRISSRFPAGVFYGTRTLLQLLPPEVFSKQPVKELAWTLPACTIQDTPRFGWRGAQLDVSRHFFGIDTVKRFIDRLADLKMNVFHWHLTDDDGWRIEIKKYPKLTSIGAWRKAGSRVNVSLEPKAYHNAKGEYGGFYTQEQIKEIIAYAKARHINILPEIDLPGHCNAVNRAYPQFTAGDSNVISASDASVQFMRDVLDEVSALFPFPYIHIGGDEVGHGAWLKDPASTARMAKIGIEGEPKKLQDWITLQIKKHLDTKNVTIIGWDELIDHDAPKDITLMAWRNSGLETRCAKAGYQTIAAPLPECYLNYNADPLATTPGHGYFNVTLQRSYLWDPRANLTPEEAKNILGGQSCIWTEYIPREQDLEWLLYPRLFALAETYWSPKQTEEGWKPFLTRVDAQYNRYNVLGIHYEIPRPQLPFNAAVFNRKVTVPSQLMKSAYHLRYTLDGTPPNSQSAQLAGLRIVDNNGLHGYQTRSGKTLLEQGIYPIRIAFLEGSGTQKLDISVSTPTQKQQPLPASWLIRDTKFTPPNTFKTETTLPTYQNNTPNLAIDGSLATKFWSSRAPKKGDHFTVHLSRREKFDTIHVITGHGSSDQLEHGVLEVSTNGKQWTPIAPFKEGEAKAKLKTSIQGIRIRCTDKQDGWLSIREINL